MSVSGQQGEEVTTRVQVLRVIGGNFSKYSRMRLSWAKEVLLSAHPDRKQFLPEILTRVRSNGGSLGSRSRGEREEGTFFQRFLLSSSLFSQAEAVIRVDAKIDGRASKRRPWEKPRRTDLRQVRVLQYLAVWYAVSFVIVVRSINTTTIVPISADKGTPSVLTSWSKEVLISQGSCNFETPFVAGP